MLPYLLPDMLAPAGAPAPVAAGTLAQVWGFLQAAKAENTWGPGGISPPGAGRGAGKRSPPQPAVRAVMVGDRGRRQSGGVCGAQPARRTGHRRRSERSIMLQTATAPAATVPPLHPEGSVFQDGVVIPGK